jgi:hypothetical protein
MRRLVLLVLSAVVLSACGSGSSAPDKAPTTKPPRVYTLAELKTALPTKEQVPNATKKVAACPGESYCIKGAVSVDFNLRPPGDEQDVERLAKEAFVPDFTSTSAKLERDAKAAKASVAKSRATLSKYDGTFDLKVKRNGKSYTPGEKGTGTVTDATVAGWRGFSASRVQKFSGIEDDGKTVAVNDTEFDITYLQVSDNRAVLTVYVALAAEQQVKGAASAMARRFAEDYIKRLG